MKQKIGIQYSPILMCTVQVLNFTRFSSKSDVWAYGVLCWEVFTCGSVVYIFCLSIFLFFCFSLSLSVLIFVSLCLYLSLRLSMSLFLYLALSVSPCFCLSVSLSSCFALFLSCLPLPRSVFLGLSKSIDISPARNF